MNPYDFVPINMKYPPQRRKPVWHNVLKSTDAHDSKLYSGYLYINIRAETPMFIPNTNIYMIDQRYPYPECANEHICNNAEQYIIPGTSLKGLLRSVVETLCNGCLRVFYVPTGYSNGCMPEDFSACQNNTSLCIACRLFGMMPEHQRNAQVFLGKVNIGDALVYGDTLSFHKSIYTAILENPKPRHLAFYFDPEKRFIAGRKFYFHHHGRLNTEDRLIQRRDDPKKFRNQYIQPLDTGTEFEARIDFTNLEADEFAALLLAITLKQDMRHKIGYGKPIGLGSIHINLTELCLVDYATRYTAFRNGRGMFRYNTDELLKLIHDRMASFDGDINVAWFQFYKQPTFNHLYMIWKWQPESLILYNYPSRDWFDAYP